MSFHVVKVDCSVNRHLSHDRTTLLLTVEIWALRICSKFSDFFTCFVGGVALMQGALEIPENGLNL